MPAIASRQKCSVPHRYEICLSFAGEDRSYVKKVAEALRKRGVKIFFDEYEKANLWGRELYEHLDYVYGSAALYCVIFISSHYAAKLWTNHERKSAQARVFKENSEYILPVRFDQTEIPGLRSTVCYLEGTSMSPEELASMIGAKLAPHRDEMLHARQNFGNYILDKSVL